MEMWMDCELKATDKTENWTTNHSSTPKNGGLIIPTWPNGSKTSLAKENCRNDNLIEKSRLLKA